MSEEIQAAPVPAEPEAPSLIQPLPEEWQAAVGELILEGCLRRKVPEVVTTAEQIIPLLERLRGLPDPYDRLTDMCGADLGDHLQVLYFLCQGYTGKLLTVKVNLPRDGRLPTATGLYALANWAEREIMEMFGVTFLGHPEHAHLLLPEGWPGYPLRKDYVYDRESEWTRPDPRREDPGQALGWGEAEEDS